MEYHKGIFTKHKNESNLDKWIELGFPELMWGLGYEMDCGESFAKYTKESPLKVAPATTEREEKRNYLYYLEHANFQIVGNFLFSEWRHFTHCSMSGYIEYDVDSLMCIIKILEDKYKEQLNKVGDISLKYIVKKIQESDFGCEERPEGYQLQVLLRLCDETGQEIDMEVLDAELLAKDINEGDWVFFDKDNEIFKEVQKQKGDLWQ